MGVVYRASDTVLHRPVAVKIVRRDTGPLAPGRGLLREAQAASALSHPNICTVFEIGDPDGKPFIVMEYLDGRRLDHIIEGQRLTRSHHGAVDRRRDRYAPVGVQLRRNLDDVLALQREVAQAIAQEIQVTVTPKERLRLARPHRVDPEAHDLYLRGRHHMFRLTDQDLDKAKALFERAIAVDPAFAPAHAALGDCFFAMTMFGVLAPEQALSAGASRGGGRADDRSRFVRRPSRDGLHQDESRMGLGRR